MGMSTFAEAPPPLFGDGGRGDWAARSDVYAHAAGLSTSGRTTLPSDPSLYDPPRTSRLTRSNVKLGGDLSPFVSEVMRPQGILQEKKYEIPAARARYSKERDTPSRGESEAHKSASRAHPSLFQSNSSMSVYASTKAKLRVPEPWHDNHPHEFKRASRPSRPSDRKDMVARKTLEEARTPLERRRALEHEAALAHAEERRVAAIDDAARVVSLRRAAAAAEIKSKFSTRRDANEAIKNRTYRWEEDHVERVGGVSTGSVLDAGDGLKTTTPRVSKYEPVDDALDPAEALTRGARQKVPRPRVVGPCAFVPLSADAYAEARRAQTVTDERRAFADEAEALRAAARRLGGAAPGGAAYAAYFEEFARSHREAEIVAGRAVHAHTKRSTLLRREAASETQRQMRELDAFEARVEYFHENDLARRLVDRGWLREDALAFGAGSAQMSSVGDGENPQASMVRARAAADARLALANRREWTDASSEE